MRKERANRTAMKPYCLFTVFVILINGFAGAGTGLSYASEADPGESTPGLAEEVNYFLDIAFGAEFGNSTERIKKWERNVTIKVHGTPTREDMKTLEAVLSELNELTGYIRIQLVKSAGEANVSLYFVPASDFDRYLARYVRSRIGFFWAWWDGDMTINRATVLIASDGISQDERSHLIREELTQALGLMHDSRKYPESIFYSGRSTVSQYAEMDKLAIRLLYLDQVRPNMTRNDVLEVLKSIDLNGLKQTLKHR